MASPAAKKIRNERNYIVFSTPGASQEETHGSPDFGVKLEDQRPQKMEILTEIMQLNNALNKYESVLKIAVPRESFYPYKDLDEQHLMYLHRLHLDYEKITERCKQTLLLKLKNLISRFYEEPNYTIDNSMSFSDLLNKYEIYFNSLNTRIEQQLSKRESATLNTLENMSIKQRIQNLLTEIVEYRKRIPPVHVTHTAKKFEKYEKELLTIESKIENCARSYATVLKSNEKELQRIDEEMEYYLKMYVTTLESIRGIYKNDYFNIMSMREVAYSTLSELNRIESIKNFVKSK